MRLIVAIFGVFALLCLLALVDWEMLKLRVTDPPQYWLSKYRRASIHIADVEGMIKTCWQKAGRPEMKTTKLADIAPDLAKESPELAGMLFDEAEMNCDVYVDSYFDDRRAMLEAEEVMFRHRHVWAQRAANAPAH